MASARQQSLLARRSKSPYSSSGKIRVLSPANNSLNSIAKQVANSELAVMTNKYNAGEVSNQDFKDFLVKMQVNPGISTTDKSEIAIQIKDFDSKIEGERLKAVYDSTANNTVAQVQAAQALKNYWNNRASGLQQGTPAFNTAITNASAYDQKIITTTDTIQKQSRANLRAIREQQANQLEAGSSAKASEKAQIWQELANQANADGDVVAANQYLAKAEQELTNSDALLTKETINAEKTDLKTSLNSLADAYHDGKINEQQYLSKLAELSSRIDATSDYGLINTLNRTTDIVQKNLETGKRKTGTTASGLPYVIKGKGSGSGGGDITNFDQEDFDYSDNLRIAKALLDKGVDGAGNPYTPKDYAEDVGRSINEHYTQLLDHIADLEIIAQANPNTKVLINGRKTRVADAIDTLDKQAQDIEGQAKAYETGKFALVEVGPRQFNKSGDVTNGKDIATFKLISTNNLPKDEYVQDSEGIFHAIIQKERPLTLAEQANVYNNTYSDANGNVFKVRTDASSGNQYLQTGQKYIKVYKPGTSESIDVAPDSKNIAPTYNDAALMKSQVSKYNPDGSLSQAAKDFAKIGTNQKPPKATSDLNGNPLNLTGIVPQAQAKEKPFQPTTSSATLAPVQPTVVAPVAPTIPKDTQISLPQQQINVPQQTGNAYVPIKTPTLKLAGSPPLTAMTPLVKPVSIAPPPKTDNSAFQKLMQTPANQRGSLSPLDFLKKIGTQIFGR